MKRTKSKNPFENCNWRQLALKLSYNGRNLHGFEACDTSNKNSIEDHLFKALKKVKITNTDLPENYTKCGRTDRGVSAYNNVVTFKGDLSIYQRALNGVLPEDIRILDIAFVPDDFNARFACIGREYRYFFLRRDKDIDLMKEASKHLIGTHDFRNFCKLNVLATTNYVRTIRELEINEVEEMTFNPWLDEENREIEEEKTKNPFDQFYIRISADAFIWHQIRCIVTVLFNIGLSLDPPEVITDLLDVEKTPRRPGYHFADPRYLVLSDCYFKEDPFEKSDLEILYEHTKEPANCYSREIEDMLLSASVNGYMLRKRKPEKSKLRIARREKRTSIYNNSLCYTVEETIASLKGSKQKRYKNILKWKAERGIKNAYEHIKFLKEEISDGEKEDKE